MQFNTEPQNQDFHIDGIRHVLPVDAYSVNEDPDFLFLDVREGFELVLALIDVQKFECCSLSVILEKLECLSKDQ